MHRKQLAIIAVLTASAPFAGAFGQAACIASCGDALRLNEIQIVGTGESAKQRLPDAVMSLIRIGGREDARELDYGEPPLADQLDAGARSLEFDIAHDPAGGLFRYPAAASMADELLDDGYVAAMTAPGFKVIHVLDVDYKSSCLTLKDCLAAVAAWSRAHKDHAPIVIALHANDRRTPMPGATRPLPFDAAAMDGLDADIRSVFAADELITPDMVQGGAATLREAVLAHGWPRLGAVRGRVMFVLDNDAAKAALYQGARRNLEGRAMFVMADEASPLAAFVSLDDPRKGAARARIAADVRAGFLVRTRADEFAVEARDNDTARRDAAFASGAQIVTTDFILPDAKIGAYKVGLSDNPRAGRGTDFAALPPAALPAVQTATAH
jgi:hypothetical protein